MNKKPKVSIIIPVYNGQNYIKEAIDSALNQTYKNIEIIVVNDGSIDDTEKICKSYGKKIRYFKKSNGGVASALNLGIEKMKGEYFSWLSHDDLYHKNKVLEQIKVLNKLEDDTVISCCHLFIDKYGNFLYKEKTNVKESLKQHPLKYLFQGSINGCDLLINKSIFEKVGKFNNNLPTTQDFDLWFRIFKEYKLYIIPKYLVFSRSHEAQGSKAGILKHIKECDELWIGFDKRLNNKEKENIYGSLYDFYKSIYTHLLTHTLYKEAIKYYKKKYIKILKNNMDLYDENEQLFPIDSKKIKEMLDFKKNKSRIFLPIYGTWADRGGLTKVVSLILNRLSDTYDIFLLSFGEYEKGYKLDHKIIRMTADIKNITNDKIINLLLILDIDIYIGVINCMLQYIQDYIYCKEYGIKTIAWNHEQYTLPYSNPDFYNVTSYRNEIYKDVDLVIWLTNYSAMCYSLHNKNGIVLKNPISVKSNNSKEKIYNKNLIAVGRFDDPRKNLDLLLMSFAEVLKEQPLSKLYIVGNYSLDLMSNNFNKKIKDIIKDLNLPDNKVIFVGHVNNVEEYYKKCSIHLLPSYDEGFGLVINEAAIYKLPSIVYEGNGFKDLIDDNISGYIVEKGNYIEYAKKIIDLLNNSEKLEQFGENAYNNTEKYQLNKIILMWKKSIDNLLNKDIHKYIKEIQNTYNDFEELASLAKTYENLLIQKLNKVNIEPTKENKLIKKVYISLKNNGLKLTLIKIMNKAKNENNNYFM